MSEHPTLDQALAALTPQGSIETESLYTFEATGEQASIWIVWTSTQVLEWSYSPSGQQWKWAHEPEGLDVSHKRGLFKDEIHLNGRVFVLPRGAGKQGSALVRAMTTHAQDGANTSQQPSGAQHYNAPPPALTTLVDQLRGEQMLLLTREVTPGEHLNNAVTSWLLLCTENAWVCWWTEDSEQGIENALWAKVEPGQLQVQKSFTRDEFWMDTMHLFSGPLLGTGGLREYAEIINKAPLARLTHVAKIVFSFEMWETGDRMLEEAQRRIEFANPIDVPLRHQVYLQRAYGAFMRQEPTQASAHLAHLTRALPEDDLMAYSSALKVDTASWWLVLAIAHEQAGDHACSTRVYAALAQGDAASVFRLQQARCAVSAEHVKEAIACYEAFIQARRQSHGFDLTQPPKGEDVDVAEATTNPDFVAACEELGALYVQCANRPMAAQTYMTLIRQAPLYVGGYERLFELADDLEGSLRAQVKTAGRILWLLDPQKAQALNIQRDDDAVDGWMTRARPLTDETHQQLIVHESEQANGAIAQKWLSQLITDKQTTQDIERHCQQLTPQTAPELMKILDRVGRVLGVPVPRVYLSHGMSGVQVMGDSRAPFVLMGSCHLSEQDPQALTLHHQVFALASQMEHIRANHLVLTSSEFWGAFRGKSLDGLVTVLSLVPMGGFLGKFTDKLAGTLLGSIKGLEQSAATALTGYIEKSLKDGTGGHVQSAYEMTLGRIAISQKSQNAPAESLLKEQLADFARAAMYTADRVGLMACDDLILSAEALLLLSPRAHAMREDVMNQGILTLLNQEDEEGMLMYAELALRISELLKFALSDERQSLRTFFHDVAEPAELNA